MNFDVKTLVKMMNDAGIGAQAPGVRAGARRGVNEAQSHVLNTTQVIGRRTLPAVSHLTYVSLPPENHQYVRLTPEDLDVGNANSTMASPRSETTSSSHPDTPRSDVSDVSVVSVEWLEDDEEDDVRSTASTQTAISDLSPTQSPRKVGSPKTSDEIAARVHGKLPPPQNASAISQPTPPPSPTSISPDPSPRGNAGMVVTAARVAQKAYLVPLETDESDDDSGSRATTDTKSRITQAAIASAPAAPQATVSTVQREDRLLREFFFTPQAVNERGENIAVYGYQTTNNQATLEAIFPQNAKHFVKGRQGVDRFANTDCLKDTLVKSAPVNANHVRFDADGKSHHFIAAQAPTQANEENFYQMVEKENVEDMVVILNDKDFKDNTEIRRHWPTDPQEGVINGYMCVSAVDLSRDVAPGLRLYVLKKEGSNKTVNLYQISRWGDHQDSSVEGTLNTVAYINAQRVARQQGRKAPLGPVLVHCNAGVGRTGTFLGIMGASATENYNPEQMLKTLRRQRAGAVQQFEQYKMMANGLELLQKRAQIKKIDSRLLGKPFYSPNVTRAEAEQLMAGQQVGTFLVRKSSDKDVERPYVISYVDINDAQQLFIRHSKVTGQKLLKFLADRGIKN